MTELCHAHSKDLHEWNKNTSCPSMICSSVTLARDVSCLAVSEQVQAESECCSAPRQIGMAPGADAFQHRVAIGIVGIVLSEVLDVHPIVPFVLVPVIVTGPEGHESELLGVSDIALVAVIGGFFTVQEAQVLRCGGLLPEAFRNQQPTPGSYAAPQSLKRISVGAKDMCRSDTECKIKVACRVGIQEPGDLLPRLVFMPAEWVP